MLHGGTRRHFGRNFKRAQPQLLGALLDAVSAALKNSSSVQLAEKPRMADFYVWSLASELAMGFAAGTFARAYRHNCAHGHELVLDASAIAPYLFRLIEDHQDSFIATTGDLLEKLNQRAKESDQKANSWSKVASCPFSSTDAPRVNSKGTWNPVFPTRPQNCGAKADIVKGTGTIGRTGIIGTCCCGCGFHACRCRF